MDAGIGANVDKDLEMFLRIAKLLVRPHLTEALNAVYGETLVGVGSEMIHDIERIHEVMLRKFWDLSKEDSNISLYMVPIMGYIRKMDKRVAQTPPRT